MDKILEVKNLKISFRTSGGTVKAVRDISMDLERGRTIAIVGESGSGKSVTSKAILGILAGNSIIEGGEVLFEFACGVAHLSSRISEPIVQTTQC